MALVRLYQGTAGAKTLGLNRALVVPEYSLNRALIGEASPLLLRRYQGSIKTLLRLY